eukprot:gb/GECH01007950.1/.p1 GENE.gb/GECH01007950.1/~~gb/GECH01007950.1/.p1  ORF type:complete len:306 (+),score=44.17 gb/GECH01007950.1/:1-918(+)
MSQPFDIEKLGQEGLMSNEFVTQAGLAYGNALWGGVQKKVSVYKPFFESVKYYFNVSNRYVLNKLKIVLFPFSHKSWQRESEFLENDYTSLPPSQDVNAPDLYIPLMSFVSYVILAGISYGIEGQFTPDILYSIATRSLAFLMLEVGFVKLLFYLLAVPNNSPVLDILAYCTYKYVPMVLCMTSGMMVGQVLYYPLLLAGGFSVVVFMIKTLRLAVVSSPDQPIKMDHQTTRRSYMVVLVAVAQLPIMFLMTFAYQHRILEDLFHSPSLPSPSPSSPLAVSSSSPAPAQQHQQPSHASSTPSPTN